MKTRRIISVIAIIVGTFMLICAFAAPGTNEDPLVSLSYITDNLIPDIHKYVDDKVEDVKQDKQNADDANIFVVVDVKEGQTLVAGKGCELILRMGSGTVIGSKSGGLADVTAGYDLGDGTTMPANHHLICPLDDGRGIKVTKDGKIMVKGSYTLK